MPISPDSLIVDEPDPAPPPPPPPPPPSGDAPTSAETSATASAVKASTDALPTRSATALRRRALDAESRVEELVRQLEQTKSALERAQRQIESSDRRAAIDAALIEAGAIDLETARLLAQASDDEAGGKGDPRILIADLKRRKPFLFRLTPARRDGAMAAAPFEDDSAALQAAAEAAAGGDRGALLRFLRLRRES